MIGSSFLLRVDREYYLVTAAHVLDNNKESTLYVGGSKNLEAITEPAVATRSARLDRSDDQFDFAFIKLSDAFSKRLGIDAFIDAKDVYQNKASLDKRCFMALGYPASSNKPKPIRVTGTHIRSHVRSYTACALTGKDEDTFTAVGASPCTHILLKFENKSKTDTGEIQKSFKPQGARASLIIH